VDRGLLRYSAADVRYTQSKDGQTVYAILLGSPEPGGMSTLGAFSSVGEVKSVSLLASGDAVEWTQADEGLTLAAPASKSDTAAVVYKILMQ
jgi:alpha-L-fucosidase